VVLLVVTEVVTTRPAAALVVTRPLVVLRLVVDWAATRPLERRLAVDRAAIRPLERRLAVDRAAIRPLERRLVVGVELRLSFRERAYHTLDKNDLRGTTYGHIERRR